MENHFQNFVATVFNKKAKQLELLVFERDVPSQKEKVKESKRILTALAKEYSRVESIGWFTTVTTFSQKPFVVPPTGKTQRFPRLIPQWDPEQKRVVKLIEEKCADMEVTGKVVAINSGPIVTEYEFVPERFTRVRRLKSVHEDLAVAIPADAVTVQRIPGKGCVGITVPNKEHKVVDFKATLKNVLAHRYDMALPLNLGIRANGDPFLEDLTLLPHLLIAGSTNSGKSVLLNGIINSLTHIRSPKELQLYMIDPKSVELLPYKDLPHVASEPVAGVYEALALMEKIVLEMRRRMSYLQIRKVKNLKELNSQLDPKDRLPYWVLVIDEMADLILQEKKLFIRSMAEISSMARAAGIHVIAATQRPSVDVLPGKVKVNFPARLSFRVPGDGDSRTILGRKGAEQLIDRGDMFYISPSQAGMQRLHSPFCQETDIARMIAESIALGENTSAVPADGPVSDAALVAAIPIKNVNATVVQ
jgi:S-DNA-T family DNA segregation ATPase FtsK/SpoIIIE